MQEKITIVVSSRCDESEKKDFLSNISSKCGVEHEIVFVKNDGGISLTMIYQENLDNSKTDIVVYLHDDIEVLSDNWGREVVRMFNDNKDYCIIGVAGSAEFDEGAAWWQYNRKYGQVLHRSNGKSWLTMFSQPYAEDLKEVCVVDGLFFAVCKPRLVSGFDLSFDGFNFYEIDFCLSNFVNGKYKIGVTTKIRLAHSSIGETKKNWFDNREKLNEKYKEFYPIKVSTTHELKDSWV